MKLVSHARKLQSCITRLLNLNLHLFTAMPTSFCRLAASLAFFSASTAIFLALSSISFAFLTCKDG